MPLHQRLSARATALGSDEGHAGAPDVAGLLLLLLLLLLLSALTPGLARAQASGSLQVAARVVPVEPSRSALTLVGEALRDPRPVARESRLAQVRIDPVAVRDPLAPRRVRVDFLKN